MNGIIARWTSAGLAAAALAVIAVPAQAMQIDPSIRNLTNSPVSIAACVVHPNISGAFNSATISAADLTFTNNAPVAADQIDFVVSSQMGPGFALPLHVAGTFASNGKYRRTLSHAISSSNDMYGTHICQVGAVHFVDGRLWRAPGQFADVERPETTAFGTAAGAQPDALAVATDGNAWTYDHAAHSVVQLDGARGVITQTVPVTAPLGNVLLSAGAHGGVWLADTGAPNVTRISAQGAVAQIPVPFPVQMMSADDAGVWIAPADGTRVVHLTNDGMAMNAAQNTASAAVRFLTAAGEGSVWLVDARSALTHLDSHGRVLATLPIPESMRTIVWLGWSHTHALTLLAQTPGAIVALRLSTSTPFVLTPSVHATPYVTHRFAGAAFDATDSLWILDAGADRLVRLDGPASVVSLGLTPLGVSPSPNALSVGAAGVMWLAEAKTDRLQRVQIRGPVQTPSYADAYEEPRDAALPNELADTSPVFLKSCVLMANYMSGGIADVFFDVRDTRTADRVDIVASDGHGRKSETETGAFAPLQLIERRIRRFPAFLDLDATSDCAITAVHFTDGSSWTKP